MPNLCPGFYPKCGVQLQPRSQLQGSPHLHFRENMWEGFIARHVNRGWRFRLRLERQCLYAWT